MWKGSADQMARSLFVLSVATIVSVFAALVAVAVPSRLRSEDSQLKDFQLKDFRSEAYRFYVQGHQQGRADAMAGQGSRKSSGAPFLQIQSAQIESLQAKSWQDGFQREYMRGYRDGYHLMER